MLGKEESLAGFERIRFDDADGIPCFLGQSASTDGPEEELDGPASSFVWLGVSFYSTRMHLSRVQVEGLMERLQRWLDTGKFS